jgi:short-subunit dehydrogenase
VKRRRTLIVGATSAIAQETAKLLAQEGDQLFLTARDAGKLSSVRDDLALRGAVDVQAEVLDVLDFANHDAIIEKAYGALGGAVDLAIIAHGVLPDQEACQSSYPLTLRAFETNALSVFSLLTRLSERFRGEGDGTLLVISSVAGERGRGSNYIYGSAKGALTLFLQGLRSRLHPEGVRVITIKAGFVDTPMTRHLKKGLIWAKPEQIAAGILRTLHGKRDVYFLPWYWRWIMLIVRVVPESIFKRLRF